MGKPRFKARAFTRINEYWDPSNPAKFAVDGHVEIVQEGAAGGEAVYVRVVSPAQLLADMEPEPSSALLGRGYIFIADYNESAMLDSIQRIIDGSGAPDWPALRETLIRYFDWLD